MNVVGFQCIEDDQPTYVVLECGDGDCCPGCGAGYKVGFTRCEFCRRPVSAATEAGYSA